MFWNKKEKIIKNNNEIIVDSHIENQINYPISDDLSKLVARGLKTGISNIKESEHNVTFLFNDGSTFSSWNANKGFAWLSSRNKFKTIEGKVINFGDALRVDNKVMKQLMLATFKEYKKELDYELPQEIKEALILSNKAERLTYEVNYMQTLIKDKLKDLETSKKVFKEKYGSDIIEILSKINY